MDDLIELARRKERLIARCALQREAVAAAFVELRTPIALVDRAVAGARFIRAHPGLVAAVVAAVVAFRRRNLLGILGRGVAAWRMWRLVSAWTDGLGRALHRTPRPGAR
jgi:hypothetical protein